MKKYLIALLFGMSLMSMQTASAATLSLAALAGGTVTAGGTPELQTGSATGSSVWFLNVDETTSPVNVKFDLGSGSFNGFLIGISGVISPPPPIVSNSFSALLSAGLYVLSIQTAGLVPYNLNVSLDAASVGDVPVPAAVWLFGSALLGLIGLTGRKSQPALAA